MKYAVERGSDGIIYIPSFIKIGSGIQKLIAGDRKSLLSFYLNTESRPP
jgi:hypothetical protein